MLQYDRQNAICAYLEAHHTASIRELAEHLFTSDASIRRDITALEAAGLVLKVYGGVVLPQHKNDVMPVQLRESANSAAKEIIALQAAELIRDGDTVFFDDSSTVRRICRHLQKRKNVKIITNNLRICNELRNPDITVYCTGGEFYQQRDCFLGPYAERFIAGTHADSVFFSCKGLSENGLLTDVSEEEISMRSTMLAHASRSYFLCDSSKLNTQYTFTLCSSKEITQILCDVPLPNFT